MRSRTRAMLRFGSMWMSEARWSKAWAEHVVERRHDRLHRRVHLDGGPREELLIGDVDGGEPAFGELGLGRLERALEVVEPLVHHLDVASRGDDELDLETAELLQISKRRID